MASALLTLRVLAIFLPILLTDFLRTSKIAHPPVALLEAYRTFSAKNHDLISWLTELIQDFAKLKETRQILLSFLLS